MNNICVKLRLREKEKYRNMLSAEGIFPYFAPDGSSVFPYAPGATLEAGEWFFITNVKEQAYSIDLFRDTLTTVDFPTLNRSDFDKIDFLFVLDERYIFFQNVSRARLVAKKRILSFGDGFKYIPESAEIAIKEVPDAIYDKVTDTLYFHKLETITSIFVGIDALYREATQEEVDEFLAREFISLKDDYSSSKVKTANRKRIALAMKTLSKYTKQEQKKVFDYIGDYCPELKVSSENAFEIGSENELKNLLYGIEQRFYTTPVGGEKRLANSVVTLE